MSWGEDLAGRHPSTWRANVESATSFGGSPGRLAAVPRGTSRPKAASTTPTIS